MEPSSSANNSEFSESLELTDNIFKFKLTESASDSEVADNDEFFDVLSSDHEKELVSVSVAEDKPEEFLLVSPDACKDEEEEEEKSDSENENDSEKDSTEDYDNKSTTTNSETYSKENSRLSVLEFLQEAEEEPRGKRETLFEFFENDRLSEISEEKDNSEESSISRLQTELEKDAMERDDRIRRTILNLPENRSHADNLPTTTTSPLNDFSSQQPLPPRRRESILRRANPLASFFEASESASVSGDSDSMISELTEALTTTRTDLTDARLSRLSSILRPDESPADGIKMAKRYKPVTVKVKAKQKSEFGSLFLIQELNRSRGTASSPPVRTASSVPTAVDPSKAIFCLKFSPDGRYLAAAGAEGIIKVWTLMQIEEDEEDTTGNPASSSPVRLATIFQSEPVQVLTGHTAEILDCAWSANNFLLTASMDKTVRLWHHSRADALGIFQHLDYVTSVAFHPKDPRMFLSGSLDCKLRLWSIQDRNIVHWNELPPGNFITAVAFTQSGNTAIAGTSGGTALIFNSDGLRYNTQILVRSTRKKSGKKITSIESVPGQYGNDERVFEWNFYCFRSS